MEKSPYNKPVNQRASSYKNVPTWTVGRPCLHCSIHFRRLIILFFALPTCSRTDRMASVAFGVGLGLTKELARRRDEAGLRPRRDTEARRVASRTSLGQGDSPGVKITMKAASASECLSSCRIWSDRLAEEVNNRWCVHSGQLPRPEPRSFKEQGSG